MPGRAEIARLVPQKGAMCLLDSVTAFSPDSIACRAVSHLDSANPLIAGGRLGVLCGCEYGMQAAALHGALISQNTLPPGRIAALRVTLMTVTRLDDPALGVLTVTARRRALDPRGLLYDFHVLAEDGRALLAGSGTVALIVPKGEMPKGEMPEGEMPKGEKDQPKREPL